MHFKGRLKLPGDRGSGIPIDLVLDDIFLDLSSQGEELGRWRLDDVEVERLQSNEFILDLEGERMVFVAADALGFAYEGITTVEEIAGRLRKRRIPWFLGGRRRKQKAKAPREATEPAPPSPVEAGSTPYLADARQPELLPEEETAPPARLAEPQVELEDGRGGEPRAGQDDREELSATSADAPSLEPVLLPDDAETESWAIDAEAIDLAGLFEDESEPEVIGLAEVETDPDVVPAESEVAEVAEVADREPELSEPAPDQVVPEAEIIEEPTDAEELVVEETLERVAETGVPEPQLVESDEQVAEAVPGDEAPEVEVVAEELEEAEEPDEQLVEHASELGASAPPEEDGGEVQPAASERSDGEARVAAASSQEEAAISGRNGHPRRSAGRNLFGRRRKKRKLADHEHDYQESKTVGGITRRICAVCGHVSFAGEDVYQSWT